MPSPKLFPFQYGYFDQFFQKYQAFFFLIFSGTLLIHSFSSPKVSSKEEIIEFFEKHELDGILEDKDFSDTPEEKYNNNNFESLFFFLFPYFLSTVIFNIEAKNLKNYLKSLLEAEESLIEPRF